MMTRNEGRIGLSGSAIREIEERRQITMDDLVDVFRSVTPKGYHEPILNHPESSKVIKAMAAVHHDLARRGTKVIQACYFLQHADQIDDPAPGARKATFTATVRRTFDRHLPISILPGEMVLDGPAKRSYVNSAAIEFSVGDEEVAAVPFEAEIDGYAANLDHYADEDGFLPEEDQVLTLKDVSRGRSSGLGSLYSEDGNLYIEDLGRDNVFDALDVGIYVEIRDAATSQTIGLVLKVLAFEDPGTEIPSGSGLFPRRLQLQVPAVIPPDETSSIYWVLRDWKDLGIELHTVTAPTGGTDDMLYLLGDNRGVYRQPSESEDQFRTRAARLQDVVSPNAINRAVNLELQQYGLRGRAEDVTDYLGLFWDEDAFDYYEPGDVFPTNRRKLLLSGNEARGWFFVFVPPVSFGEFGFGFDAPGPTLDLGSEILGPAWDSGFFDGYAAGASAIYAAIYSSVYAKKLGFVGFSMILDDTLV